MDGGHARGRNSGGLLQLMQAKQGSPSRVRFFEGEGSGFEQLLINQHYHWLIQNFIDEGWKVLKVYYIRSLGCDYLTILYMKVAKTCCRSTYVLLSEWQCHWRWAVDHNNKLLINAEGPENTVLTDEDSLILQRPEKCICSLAVWLHGSSSLLGCRNFEGIWSHMHQWIWKCPDWFIMGARSF